MKNEENCVNCVRNQMLTSGFAKIALLGVIYNIRNFLSETKILKQQSNFLTRNLIYVEHSKLGIQ